jgi:hypothetical protein
MAPFDDEIFDRWSKKSDEALLEEADAGLRGQGAMGEMQRRLRTALVEQMKAADRLSKRIYWLNVVLVVLTVVITVLTTIMVVQL